MSFDASNEEPISICLGVVNKVSRGLFSGDGDQGYTLVGRFEPDDLRALGLGRIVIDTVAFPFTTFGVLLFLSGCRGRAEKTKSTREQLSWHAFNNSDDMARELRFDFVGNSARWVG